MELLPEIEAIYRAAAAGDEPAYTFLKRWNFYCHRIDDLIDNAVKSPDELLGLLIDANLLYSHPYYQAHARELVLVVAGITGRYLQSVEWEDGGDSKDDVYAKLDDGPSKLISSPRVWRRQWADTLRFAGNEMVEAVAMIEGGFELQQRVGAACRENSWTAHHAGSAAV